MKNIEIKQLGHLYDRRKTDGISKLDFEIPLGKVFSLIGPSGSGKSTTLKCIAGIISDYKGEIFFPEKMSVSYLDQNISKNISEDSVYDFLDKKLAYSESDPDKRSNQIRTSLLELELTNEIESQVKNLSGGQQQRVFLAYALITNPTLLLLDEPFANLDPILRKSFLQELFELLKQRDVTLVMVTHSVEEALCYSDKVAVLNHGKIQQIGSPKEVYYHPTNIFTAQFISDSNIITAKVLEQSETHASIKIYGELKQVKIEQEISSSHIFVHIPKELISISQTGELKGQIESAEFLGPNSLYTVIPDSLDDENDLYILENSIKVDSYDKNISFSIPNEYIYYISEA